MEMLSQNVNDNGENGEIMRDEESILDDNTDEIDEHIDVGVQGDVGDASDGGMDYDWINEKVSRECLIFAFFYVLKVFFQTRKS